MRGRFRDNNSARNLSPSFSVMYVKTFTFDVVNHDKGHPLSTSMWGLAQKRRWHKLAEKGVGVRILENFGNMLYGSP